MTRKLDEAVESARQEIVGKVLYWESSTISTEPYEKPGMVYPSRRKSKSNPPCPLEKFGMSFYIDYTFFTYEIETFLHMSYSFHAWNCNITHEIPDSYVIWNLSCEPHIQFLSGLCPRTITPSAHSAVTTEPWLKSCCNLSIDVCQFHMI